MGQHKYNQRAIDAKDGKLEPKKKNMSKAKRDRLIYKMCEKKLFGGLYDALMDNLRDKSHLNG